MKKKIHLTKKKSKSRLPRPCPTENFQKFRVFNMLILQTGSFWVDEKKFIYAKVILWTENNLETAYFLENGYNDFDLLTNVFKNPMTV